MRALISERKDNNIEYGLIYGAICSFILFATYVATNIIDLPRSLSGVHCIFRSVTHIPCLTCGMTRSTISLAHLHVAESFILNPLTCLTMIGLLFWALWSLINLPLKSRYIKIEFTPIERKILIYSLIGTILINWIYLIIVQR